MAEITELTDKNYLVPDVTIIQNYKFTKSNTIGTKSA